jgi:PEP-CTERM motif
MQKAASPRSVHTPSWHPGEIMHSNAIARSLRPVACAWASCVALAASPPAAAELMNYQFTLNPSPTYWYFGVVGSGWFTVDDATIPDAGSFSIVATDLMGVLGNGQAFGYAYGNSSITGFPNDPITTLTPHTDALISFQDGVATGITYQEQHTCSVAYHCLPNHQVSFSGAAFDVFAYASLRADGTLSISPAVPEPSTVALMLGGLCATMLMRRRRR